MTDVCRIVTDKNVDVGIDVIQLVTDKDVGLTLGEVWLFASEEPHKLSRSGSNGSVNSRGFKS